MHLNYLRNYSLLILGAFLWHSCGSDAPVQMPPQQINTVEVLQKDVPVYREFVGQVYGEKDIPIRARVEGFLEGMHFDEGFYVEKGQLLYTIDPKPFEARVNTQRSKVAEAETMMVKAKSDLERIRPLAKLNAVSKSDLDAAEAQYEASVSSLNAAQSNLKSSQIELGYTKIYSPINGLIGITEARVGDFVGREPNPVILNTVSQTENVKVRFFLSESDYLYLGREATRRLEHISADELDEQEKIKLELILSDGTTYDQKGIVDFVDRGINASTGSILVQANFPNPKLLLRPGLYAKVKIPVRQFEGGLVIPERCIMELQGIHSVFVVNDKNIVTSRQVTLGPAVGDERLVTEGLEAGEKIVIDALQKVRDGMEVAPELIEFKSKTNQQ